MDLTQLKFISSAFKPFTKNKKIIKKLKETGNYVHL